MNSADDVILHIGLHKTGTRYLQRMVLRQLDDSRFAVNPPEVLKPVRRAVRKPDDPEKAAEAQAAVEGWQHRDDPRTLVLSEPHICGDMFSGYHDYAENLALIRRLFPQARILYVVRNQADWLHSAYRQHLARGKPVPIETFLNYFDGAFQPRAARSVNGVRNMEALTLPFLAIYQAYVQAYGPERVTMLNHKDLKRDPERFNRRVAECLGIDRLPEPPTQRSQNRSYSALAIHLFHPATLRRPRPLVASENRRSTAKVVFDPVRKRLRRLRRAFIQHVFDRIIYVDWDLLERQGMRERIEHHYADENSEIERITQHILLSGPGLIPEDQGKSEAKEPDP